MARHPRIDRPLQGVARHRRPSGLAAVVLALVTLAAVVPLGAPVVAAEEDLSVAGRALLQGHTRTGAWMAVAVDVANDGPAIVGELRLAGGVAGRTRFGIPVDLPTGSRKTYVLYGQPPSFGGTVEVQLVVDGRATRTVEVAIALHESSQLVVGVVAEDPARLVGQFDLLPAPSGLAPAVVPLTLADLPDRVEGWGALDRLVWQDVDTAQLSTAQLDALRGWVAAGGRLLVVGGTTGIDVVSGLPDELLPYRPTALLDVEPDVLAGLLGDLPEDAATLPAMAGELGRGRALATSGDRVIAAEATFGTGTVTVLGFDPATPWMADSEGTTTPLWQRFLPPRGGTTPTLPDDGSLVSAVSNLPSLALPPIGGLLVLLFGYILLVGPVNYIVLRWLDRREWAWVTIPALIGVFTVGAFGFGTALRGSDLIVHEVAIVRGAPGTSQGTTQSYLGLFSPTRTTYQLLVPGGALLSAPISGDLFGNSSGGPLDVLQGDPSRVRDLAIGFGSLRTVRADSAVTVPVVEADVRLEDGRVRGVIRNRSDRVLEDPAVVLGASSTVLPDIPAGGEATVDLPLTANPFTQGSLPDRVVGQVVFTGDGSSFDTDAQRRLVRRSMVEQLTYDPFSGFANVYPADTAVLLAWGTEPVVPLEVEGYRTRRVANVLYTIPMPLAIRGTTAFRSDLIRSSVVEADALSFSRDPWSLNFGTGTVRMAYRPIPFQGTFTARKVVLGMGFGGDIGAGLIPEKLEPAPPCVEGDASCAPEEQPFFDGVPEVELRDHATGEWVAFPHLQQGRAYEVASPERWVDPATGELQVRFVNERADQVSFGFAVQLEGVVS